MWHVFHKRAPTIFLGNTIVNNFLDRTRSVDPVNQIATNLVTNQSPIHNDNLTENISSGLSLTILGGKLTVCLLCLLPRIAKWAFRVTPQTLNVRTARETAFTFPIVFSQARPSVFQTILNEQVADVSRGAFRAVTKGLCGLELLCASRIKR